MKYIINTCFLVIIFILALNNALNIIDKKENNENRKLADKPVVNLSYLDPYPAEYEAFLNDNFSSRSYFIASYQWLNTAVFKKSKTNGNGLIGDDDFIFEMKKNLSLYSGKRSLTDEQLDKVITEFSCRKAYFDSLGIKMYVRIIPSKYKVYTDKLPFFFIKGENNMGDRFIEALHERTNIDVIDALPILLKNKADNKVYFKYDAHWSYMGCFFSNIQMINHIKKDFPSLSMEISDFDFTPDLRENGNLRWYARENNGVEEIFKITPKHKTIEVIDGYIHKHNGFRYGQKGYFKRVISDNKNAPKALIIRDSFENYGSDYLPECFSETLYLWDNWEYKFNKTIVDYEKPDIIIYSLYEGYIDRLLLNPSFVAPNTDLDADDVQ